MELQRTVKPIPDHLNRAPVIPTHQPVVRSVCMMHTLHYSTYGVHAFAMHIARVPLRCCLFPYAWKQA